MAKFVLSVFADEIAPDLQSQMDVLDKYGIKYIEMRGVNGKCIVDYSLDEVNDIKKQLDKRGFGISAVGSPIGKIGIKDEFEPHLKLFKHTVQIAKILGTKYIRMFSFFMPKGEPPEKYRDEVLRRWGEFVKAAEGEGVILLHENEKEIYGDTAERCLDILKSIDSGIVKAAFDPANFIQCDVKTYPDAYDLLKDYIVHMHIKDALYSNHGVVPSGYGDGNVKQILKKLKDTGYEGFLTIEPHLASFKGFSALEHDAKIDDTSGDGAKMFSIALSALLKILKEIEQPAEFE
ncbi:MAG TPA: xylose isomerase [Clostridiaceae bacterium]|nr:xylose isomerase [Clostridiaceae bacterium]